MRHLVVIIDMSKAMANIDLKPNRFVCTMRLIEKFTADFVDQNPISQICFITTRNKRAERITDLNGNLKTQLDVLQSKIDEQCYGEASLQNALHLAYTTLRLVRWILMSLTSAKFISFRHMPPHTSKEVLVIMGSLTTCDPSNIHTTIDLCAKSHIRCSVIGLAAEVFICKSLAAKTNGTYNVIMDETHYRDSIFQHLNPLPSSVTESALMKMGFPQFITEGENKPSLCVCHLDEEPNFGISGYFCPQCNSKYCDLPVECKVCGLTLVSSSHLARSYHHLFPVDSYQEKVEPMNRQCAACLILIEGGKIATICDHCHNIYCIGCDSFIHNISHVCPGCSSKNIPIVATTTNSPTKVVKSTSSSKTSKP